MSLSVILNYTCISKLCCFLKMEAAYSSQQSSSYTDGPVRFAQPVWRKELKVTVNNIRKPDTSHCSHGYRWIDAGHSTICDKGMRLQRHNHFRVVTHKTASLIPTARNRFDAAKVVFTIPLWNLMTELLAIVVVLVWLVITGQDSLKRTDVSAEVLKL